MIACSIFYEVLHSEAICRKCDVTHQDVAFLRRCFVDFGGKKKVKQKPVPYTHQDVTFFRRCFAAFNGQKGDAGAAALYASYGEKSKCTVLPSWETDRPWLLVKQK